MATKQEEIEKGILRIQRCEDGTECPACKCLDEFDPCAECRTHRMLIYLHSQGLRLSNGEALVDETNK